MRALDGVNLDFAKGRFTAIMGPSGSGKSTLQHCVAGLARLTSGQVYIGDAELGALNDKQLTDTHRSLAMPDNMDAMTPAVAPAPQATPVAAPEVVARAIDAVKVYGKGDAAVRALDGISVAFQKRQFTAIMGPSGSGKSTLLHCLAGLDSLTEGKIVIGDTDLGALSEKQLTLLRRERVGFIFQAYNLVPTLSAADNITLPLAIAGRKPDPATLSDVVGKMRLGDRLTHRPAELSGGQQQRVAAARALVSKPDIIFADEPTGNLDSRSGAELLGFLRSAVDDGQQTIVMVTHDPGAASRADRVVFLADGKVVREMADPTSDAILEYMKTLGN